MQFAWDEKKNAANVRKHSLRFEDAVRIFEGDIVEKLDDGSHDEERWVAIGVTSGKEVVVIYVEKREDIRRIISARGATRKERKDYWRAVGGD